MARYGLKHNPEGLVTGADDYVSISSDTALDFGQGRDVSIFTYIRNPELSAGNQVYLMSTGDISEGNFNLVLNDDSTLQVAFGANLSEKTSVIDFTTETLVVTQRLAGRAYIYTCPVVATPNATHHDLGSVDNDAVILKTYELGRKFGDSSVVNIFSGEMSTFSAIAGGASKSQVEAIANGGKVNEIFTNTTLYDFQYNEGTGSYHYNDGGSGTDGSPVQYWTVNLTGETEGDLTEAWYQNYDGYGMHLEGYHNALLNSTRQHWLGAINGNTRPFLYSSTDGGMWYADKNHVAEYSSRVLASDYNLSSFFTDFDYTYDQDLSITSDWLTTPLVKNSDDVSEIHRIGHKVGGQISKLDLEDKSIIQNIQSVTFDGDGLQQGIIPNWYTSTNGSPATTTGNNYEGKLYFSLENYVAGETVNILEGNDNAVVSYKDDVISFVSESGTTVQFAVDNIHTDGRMNRIEWVQAKVDFIMTLNGVEQVSTLPVNIVLHSESIEIEGSVWSDSRATREISSELSSQGTEGCTYLFDDDTDSQHDMRYIPDVILNGGKTYTFSLEVKSTEQSNIDILFPIDVSGAAVNFNLFEGTINSFHHSITPAIEPLGNGWFRLICTALKVGDSSPTIRLRLRGKDNLHQYIGDFTGVLVNRAQLTESTSALPYVESTDTPAYLPYSPFQYHKIGSKVVENAHEGKVSHWGMTDYEPLSGRDVVEFPDDLGTFISIPPWTPTRNNWEVEFDVNFNDASDMVIASLSTGNNSTAIRRHTGSWIVQSYLEGQPTVGDIYATFSDTNPKAGIHKFKFAMTPEGSRFEIDGKVVTDISDSQTDDITFDMLGKRGSNQLPLDGELSNVSFKDTGLIQDRWVTDRATSSGVTGSLPSFELSMDFDIKFKFKDNKNPSANAGLIGSGADNSSIIFVPVGENHLRMRLGSTSTSLAFNIENCVEEGVNIVHINSVGGVVTATCNGVTATGTAYSTSPISFERLYDISTSGDGMRGYITDLELVNNTTGSRYFYPLNEESGDIFYNTDPVTGVGVDLDFSNESWSGANGGVLDSQSADRRDVEWTQVGGVNAGIHIAGFNPTGYDPEGLYKVSGRLPANCKFNIFDASFVSLASGELGKELYFKPNPLDTIVKIYIGSADTGSYTATNITVQKVTHGQWQNLDESTDKVFIPNNSRFYALDDNLTVVDSLQDTNLWFDSKVSYGAQWVDNGDGTYTHLDGGAQGSLTSYHDFKDTDSYVVTYTIAGLTQGNFRIRFGSEVNGTLRTVDGTYTETLIGSTSVPNEFRIVADAAANGTVSDISIIKVTDGTWSGTPTLTSKPLEVREERLYKMDEEVLYSVDPITGVVGNLILHSNTYDQLNNLVGWSAGGNTLVTHNAVNYDGTLTASTITKAGSSANERINTYVYNTSEKDYTFSLYIKNINCTQTTMGLRWDAIVLDRVNLNWDGTTLLSVTSQSGSTSNKSFSDEGNGWYRVSFSAEAKGSYVAVELDMDRGSGSNLPNSMLLGGAQLLDGTNVLPYSETTGTAIDSLSYQGTWSETPPELSLIPNNTFYINNVTAGVNPPTPDNTDGANTHTMRDQNGDKIGAWKNMDTNYPFVPVLTGDQAYLGVANPLPVPLLNMPLESDLSMRQGTGTATFTRNSEKHVFNSDGTYQVYGIDEPAFKDGRYFSEPSAENLWSDSAQGFFGNTPDIVSITEQSPDGANEARELVTNSSANRWQHTLQPDASTVAGDTYTISWHQKILEGTPQEHGSMLTIKALENCTNTNPEKIWDSGDGWERFFVTFTVIADATTTFMRLYMSGWAFGIPNQAHMWGWQVEKGSVATSYIPTSGSAVTRGADSLRFPTAGNFPTSGDLTVQYTGKSYTGTTAGIPRAYGVYMNDGGGNRFAVRHNDSGKPTNFVYGDGISPSTMSTYEYADGTITGVINGDGGGAVYLDGVQTATGTRTYNHAIEPTMYVGCSNTSGSSNLTGVMDSLKFFEHALTQAQISGVNTGNGVDEELMTLNSFGANNSNINFLNNADSIFVSNTGVVIKIPSATVIDQYNAGYVLTAGSTVATTVTEAMAYPNVFRNIGSSGLEYDYYNGGGAYPYVVL